MYGYMAALNDETKGGRGPLWGVNCNLRDEAPLCPVYIW